LAFTQVCVLLFSDIWYLLSFPSFQVMLKDFLFTR